MKAAELFDVGGCAVAITGGAAGLGRAYAEAMAANGADVLLIDRDSERLAATAESLRSFGGRVEIRTLDVTDSHALATAIRDTVAVFGKLDVVFANAGIAAGAGFLDLDGARQDAGAVENIAAALWDRVLDVNLRSVITTIAAAAPIMKQQGSGRIVVTASIGGTRPSPVVGSPYGVSKAAILHLVRQTALELARYGVRVNAILPGPFLTELTTPELEKVFARNSPMHRVASMDEIKGLALFLASSASSYVTGAHMVIDGGATLGRAD